MNTKAYISPNIASVITISDLKDDYFEDCTLSSEQLNAIKTFDKYKLSRLSNIREDADFQKVYYELQVIENTMDYTEFLDQLRV